MPIRSPTLKREVTATLPWRPAPQEVECVRARVVRVGCTCMQPAVSRYRSQGPKSPFRSIHRRRHGVRSSSPGGRVRAAMRVSLDPPSVRSELERTSKRKRARLDRAYIVSCLRYLRPEPRSASKDLVRDAILLPACARIGDGAVVMRRNSDLG
ncbi:hypothetical protein B0H12DRAFT_433838 [Mycena haematopus]|nr:hypothetical protein B0H12DRAFT_433838 [Mycena haematopus]